MEIKQSNSQYDIIVVGTGLAGIRAAVSSANAGKKVLLISSSKLCSGSSFYPLMDTLHCLCTAGPEDKELFYQDIRDCSQQMNDPWMGKYYIDHIEECIQNLPDTGIDVHKLPEKKIACFGHTYRDLYYWKNWEAIRKNVYDTLAQNENISLLEHTDLVHLVLSGKRISGALLLNKNGLEHVATKAVILSGGGMGGLYLHNLNTADVYGSVQAIALKAGAKLINLEYNQFIPGFISPIHKIVFREGSLRYCTGVFDSENRDVLKELLPDPEAYQDCLVHREPHGPFTFSSNSRYFDIALMKSILRQIEAENGQVKDSFGCLIRYSPDILKDERSYVQDYLHWLKTEHKIDIDKAEIRIAPFFHAANGGILIDHSCGTDVEGLFACGECAGGIHGADRLGGMASGSCLVFGTLAAKSACHYVENQSQASLSPEDIYEQFRSAYFACGAYQKSTVANENNSLFLQDEHLLSPQEICLRIKELMWQYGNIIRTEDGLEKAMSEINSLGEILNQSYCLQDYDTVPGLKAFLKAHQFVDLSRALLLSMQSRKESRGSHYREDFPKTDSLYEYKRTVISIKDKEYQVSQVATPLDKEMRQI